MHPYGDEKEIIFNDMTGSDLQSLVTNFGWNIWHLKKNDGDRGIKMFNGDGNYLYETLPNPEAKPFRDGDVGFDWELEHLSGNCSMFEEYFDITTKK